MQINQNRDIILSGNMYKAILRLSLPLILTNLIQTIYNLTDTYFVSLIGDTQVAAIGLVTPVIFCMLGIGIGVANASKALISQYTGAGQLEDARHVSGQILTLSVMMAALLTALGFLLAPWIVRTMGATGDVYRDGLIYLRIIMFESPFLFLFLSYQSIRQGEGSMAMPLVFSVLSVLLNIALDPIFIFVFKMGVAGAATATILARFVFTTIAIITLFTSKKSMLKPSFRDLIPDFKVMYSVLKVGVPASLGRVTSSLGFMVLSYFVISYGNDVLTAYTLGNRIVNLVMMPCLGIGGAVTIIIGQNIGANNIKRTTEAFKKAMLMGLLIAVGAVIIMAPLRLPFIKAFTQTPSVIDYTKNYVNIVLFAMPLMCFMEIILGVFYGSGYSHYAMAVSMTRLWLFRLPTIVILKYLFHMNEYAVWYPIIISNLLACAMGMAIYMRGKWKAGVIR